MYTFRTRISSPQDRIENIYIARVSFAKCNIIIIMYAYTTIRINKICHHDLLFTVVIYIYVYDISKRIKKYI